MTATSHPYDALTPDTILDAVERLGFSVTGAFYPLNSYENRVYRLETEQAPVVAKFYRPGRWSREAILEEHAFTAELRAQEIPSVPPWANPAGDTLHSTGDFLFAVYPWQRGRAIELNTREDRARFGRFLGRLHRVGQAKPFLHRLRLSPTLSETAVHTLTALGCVPASLRESFFAIADLLTAKIREAFERIEDVAWIRLHGDCHVGNVLWLETGPFFLDFDDCASGPAVQDLWMLLSGDPLERREELGSLLEGYEEFMDFNRSEIGLIEPLRALRMLRYSAWIAERWTDPAFPIAFPWFGNHRYWEEQILMLREQLAMLDEA
jgi:Ser/Thr protein kinase RdoA (MazF antagonist)